MQDQHHEQDFAGEMDAHPRLSQPPYSNMGFGGFAEAGVASIEVASSFANNPKYHLPGDVPQTSLDVFNGFHHNHLPPYPGLGSVPGGSGACLQHGTFGNSITFHGFYPIAQQLDITAASADVSNYESHNDDWGMPIKPNVIFDSVSGKIATPPRSTEYYGGDMPMTYESFIDRGFLPTTVPGSVPRPLGYDESIFTDANANLINGEFDQMTLPAGPTEFPNWLFVQDIPIPNVTTGHALTDNPSAFSMQQAYSPTATSGLGTNHVHSDISNTYHSPAAIPASFLCTNCTRTFTRSSDLDRHTRTVHGVNRGTHLCPIANCAKSQGAGYSRADKLKEHMYLKHAGLGFVKGRG